MKMQCVKYFQCMQIYIVAAGAVRWRPHLTGTQQYLKKKKYVRKKSANRRAGTHRHLQQY